MTDFEWLTPRQLSALPHEEQEKYIRQRINELQEEISDDEPLAPEDAMNENQDSLNPDDSGEEIIQMPDFHPEEDSEEEFDDEPQQGGDKYICKDKIIWSSPPPSTSRLLPHNILRTAKCGPVRKTKGLCIVNTFKLILSDEMCDIIIRETNKKAKHCYDGNCHSNPTAKTTKWRPLTKTEFDAYLGLLLLSGVTHSGHVHTKDLWKTTSHPLYRAAMSVRRFWAISRFIRFDN